MNYSHRNLGRQGRKGGRRKGVRGKGKIPILIRVNGSLEADVEYELEAYGVYAASNERSNSVRRSGRRLLLHNLSQSM